MATPPPFLPWVPPQILALDDASQPGSYGGAHGRSRALHLALGAAGHLVTVLPWFDGRSYETPQTRRELLEAGIEVVYHNETLPRAVSAFFTNWARRDRPSGCGARLSLRVALRSLPAPLCPRRYDVVIVSRPHMFVVASEWVEGHFPNAHLIYDADAVASQVRAGLGCTHGCVAAQSTRAAASCPPPPARVRVCACPQRHVQVEAVGVRRGSARGRGVGRPGAAAALLRVPCNPCVHAQYSRHDVLPLQAADGVIVVSSADAAALRHIATAAAPHAADGDAPPPPAAAASLPRFSVASLPLRVVPSALAVPPHRRRSIVFLGAFPSRGLPYYHNGDAVLHWAQAIAPRVHALLGQLGVGPLAHPFVVLGRDPPPRVAALHRPEEGVIVRGFVEDLGPELATARLVVVPHQYSAGACHCQSVMEGGGLTPGVCARADVKTHVAGCGAGVPI